MSLLYFLAGGLIGLRYSSIALVPTVPLALALAVFLSWTDVVDLGPWAVLGLLVVLEAGFLAGSIAHSLRADRATGR